MSQPQISIIIATYNASMMLGYAIRSVLESSFEDWELLVIGDHCTDDTAEVVTAFADPRIRFHNLPENSGQQATPNNVGVDMARGRYLCFLNQDDMYQPHHLQLMLDTLQKEAADMVMARGVFIEADAPLDGSPLPVTNAGYSPSNPGYQPDLWYLASFWFLTRELAERIGPWRLEGALHVTPSQDWLFRVYRSGARLVFSRRNSVIALPTTGRGKNQGELRRAEHDHVYRTLVASHPDDAEFKARVAYLPEPPWWRPRELLKRIYRATLAKLLMACGVHPRALVYAVKYRGRGNLVRWSVNQSRQGGSAQ